MARAPRKEPEPEVIATLPHPRTCPKPFGHQRIITGFEHALTNHTLPHAWLLSGPEGIGKATVAYYLTRKLFAASSTGFFAPTEDELAQRIASGSHPDLLVLETSPDKTTIPVDEVREIMHLMHHTPYESFRRIVIIDPIESLNPNAANALLKVLEEPPSHAIFFLISHRPNQLLPTIRSRCLMVHMHTPVLEETLSILRNIQPSMPAHEARAYLELSSNAPGFAIQLAEAEALTIYTHVLTYIESIKQPILSWECPLLQFSDVPCFSFILDIAFNRLIKYLSGISVGETLIENELELLGAIGSRLNVSDLINLRESLLEQLHTANKIHLDKSAILRSML